MLFRIILFVLLVGVSSAQTMVQLPGKQLLRGKVFGMGYSVAAKSLSQCMEACNAHSATCDGVVYHEVISKCRLLKKCAAALQIDNSTSGVYYSKRPLITTEGYLYVTGTDSCLGPLPVATDYATSDITCTKSGGRLVIIKNRRTNAAVVKLLRKSKMEWAWIGESKNGNSVAGEDGFVPDMVEKRNETTSGCWAINISGQWAQFPCKKHELRGLCEVLPFPS